MPNTNMRVRDAYVGLALWAAVGVLAGCNGTTTSKDFDQLFDEALTEAVGAEGDVVFDCDELPDLTPEEEAMGPLSPPRLEKSATTRSDGTPYRYALLADVELTRPVADKVEEIDDAYFKRTGKHLTVTSGTRDAAQQAKAMVKMMRLGGDPVRLYRNKDAAREIKRAYETGRAAKKSPADLVDDVYLVIQKQIARGEYISAHLRAGAVDLRSRDMRGSDKKHFTKVVGDLKGVEMLEEFTPPHFHLQID